MYHICIRFILMQLVLLVSMVGVYSQPITSNFSYSFSRVVSRKEEGILLSSWKVTSSKEVNFGDDSGSISYFQGISSFGTNIIRQELYVRVPEEREFERIGILEIYYNRYSEGGMLTNVLDSTTPYPIYAYPSDDWFVGTVVRKSDYHKLVENCHYSITYDNSGNNEPWVIRHPFSGNKGDFDITIRVAARGTSVFSPGLDDVKKETGKNYAYAYAGELLWWVPWDDPLPSPLIFTSASDLLGESETRSILSRKHKYKNKKYWRKY